jgi:choline/glycine/proline betaine transport protein
MAVALTRALHADYLGYSLDDLVAGRTPRIDPMGSDSADADRAHPPPKSPHEH